MLLQILKYNNYYNRIVKIEPDLESYQPYVTYQLDNTNFNTNDFVYTEHVIGTGEYDGSGDYLLVVDGDTLVSRWFILEAKRLRGGQFSLQLYRDAVADYYTAVIYAPTFIEKATLPIDSSLLFNHESMTFNQVKKSEYQLRDKSRCAWLVGYYARNATDLSGTIPTNSSEAVPAIPISTPIESWKYYQYNSSDNPFVGAVSGSKIVINVAARFQTASLPGQAGFKYSIDLPSGTVSWKYYNDNKDQSIKNTVDGLEAVTAAGVQQYIKEQGYVSQLTAEAANYLSTTNNADIDELLSYNGKLIRDTNGKIFQVTVTTSNNKELSHFVDGGNLFLLLDDVVIMSKTGENYCFIGSAKPNKSFEVVAVVSTYIVTLTQQFGEELRYDLSSSAKLITEDAPYNIFAIPYGRIKINNVIDNYYFYTDPEVSLATAAAMQAQETTSKIYDIQLLPYCPVPELITDVGELTVTDNKQFSIIQKPSVGSAAFGIIFNVVKSKFSTSISYPIPMGKTATERKINNECDKWRLTAPNYSNYFDFSVEKNDGVYSFGVDCTYKPFTPYIHINPYFKGLYGYDDNSPRGLVLGGDFSITQIVNKWEEYQIQNKNFQNIFDRQIQNMEVNNSVQRTRETVQAITGSMQGAAAGAAAGAMLGGGVGALAGGLAGGIASAVGGIYDIKLNEKLRNEAIDYTKDLYGYNLGNIQALPITLSKVSAFTNNNKIFPLLEYYTATDTEKEAFRNKLKYNGMTVMAIGTINEYLQAEKSYIKGQIIRLENIGEDYHIVNAIASEINKGVFI